MIREDIIMKYEKPTIKLVKFESADIITLSNTELTMNAEDILEYEALGIFFE